MSGATDTSAHQHPDSPIPAGLVRYLRNVIVVVDLRGMIVACDGGFGLDDIDVRDVAGRSIFDFVERDDAATLAQHLMPLSDARQPIAFPTPFPITLLHPLTGVRVPFDVLATAFDDAEHGPGWVLSMTARADISASLTVAADLFGHGTFDDACRALATRDTRTTPDGRRTVLHAVVRPHSADRIVVTGDEASHTALALGLLPVEVGERLWPADVRGTDNDTSLASLPADLRKTLRLDGMTDCYLARIGDGPQAFAWLLWAVDEVGTERARGSNIMSRLDTISLLDRAARSTTPGRARNSAALIDPLTGLLNREGLGVMSSPVDMRRCAIAIFTVTGLRDHNALAGHQSGDEVLAAIAVRLRAQVRSGDYIARISGSEFAMLMPQTTIDEARPLADRQLALTTASDVEPVVTAPIDLLVAVSADPFVSSLDELLASALGHAVRTAAGPKLAVVTDSDDPSATT